MFRHGKLVPVGKGSLLAEFKRRKLVRMGEGNCWQCYVGHVVPCVVRNLAGSKCSGIDIKKMGRSVCVHICHYI